MRTRFAPSPTGRLHLGHAFSALTAWDMACAAGGQFLLRIEDIDTGRVRPEFEAGILTDLAWLGLSWPEPAMRQSERGGAYAAALAELGERGLTYACTCSRRDIAATMNAPQEGASGCEGTVYPGTCRGGNRAETGAAIRLDMARAILLIGGPDAVRRLGFVETGPGHEGRHALDPERLLGSVGDIVLARRDIGVSYHLAVVVDDAAQGIDTVVRGADLLEATDVHVILQTLLGLPTPDYHHHRLIRDAGGRRLAKRDAARAIERYREEGASPEDIRKLVQSNLAATVARESAAMRRGL